MPNVIMSHRLRVRNRTTGEWDDIPAIGSGGSIADLETEEADEMDAEEAAELSVDRVPTAGSDNLITSGAVATAIAAAEINPGSGTSGSGSTDSILQPADIVIPSTVADYHALYNKFVTDGYALREQLGTVEGYPIYAYYFAFDTVRMDPNYNLTDFMPDEIPEASASGYFKKRKILFTSGEHGNEKASPAALYRFLYKLCYDPEYIKYQVFDYYVVPLINPTGYAANTRANYQNIDINRDTGSKITVETQLVTNFISQRTYELAMDFHQAPSHNHTNSSEKIVGFINQQGTEDPIIEDMVNEKLAEANHEVQRAINIHFGKPADEQTCYIWQHATQTGTLTPQSTSTFRGFSYLYSKASCCLETTTSCYHLSHTSTAYNETARICTYTYQNQITRRMLDLVIEKFHFIDGKVPPETESD